MSNLMNTAEGRAALIVAQKWLLERRMSRFFKRNTAIELNNYFDGQGFSLENMLADLNVGHDDEILEIYRLLGAIGFLTETVADMTYYVNATTGSDSEGDGSETKPYETMWFLSNLPKTIAHKVNIVLQSNVYEYTTDLVIDNTFKGDGCLSFIGQGAPQVVSGPYTVAAKTDLYNDAGSVIQATTAIGGTFERQFIRILSATDPDMVGNAVPITSHPDTDEVLVRRLPVVNVQAGDTFDICIPTNWLHFQTITVNGQGMSHYKTDDYIGSRVCFVNLRLSCYNFDPSQDTIKIDSSVDTAISFCTLQQPSRLTINSNLNRLSPVETDLETLANCGVKNWVLNDSGAPFGAGITSLNSGPGIADSIDFVVGKNPIIQLVHTDDIIKMDRSTVSLAYFSSGSVEMRNSNGEIKSGLILGYADAADSAAIHAMYSNVYVENVALVDAKQGITVSGEAVLRLFLVGKDPTYGAISDYGLWLNGLSRVVLESDPANLVGTLGSISFNAVSPSQTPAFPAVFAQATDSQGSLVKRLGV